MTENVTDMTPPQERPEKIAEANFSRWNEALLTRDPQRVAALYAVDATFLPTVSGDFKRGPAEAEGYFKHFLEKTPSGEIVEGAVQTLGQNCYLHSGMYNFEVGPDDNRSTMEARFSMVWRTDERGEWKIIHHHSSVKPKKH